jgi:hypothetical protein
MRTHTTYIPETHAGARMVSVYAWRHPDDGEIHAYVTHGGTVSKPGELRGFSWDDIESEGAAAALAAVILAWVHLTSVNQPLPFG